MVAVPRMSTSKSPPFPFAFYHVLAAATVLCAFLFPAPKYLGHHDGSIYRPANTTNPDESPDESPAMTLGAELCWAIADCSERGWGTTQIQLHINQKYRSMMTDAQRDRNGISQNAVKSVVERWRWCGDPVADGRRLQGDKVLSPTAKDKLHEYVADRPDMYLEELRDKLIDDGERCYAVSTLCSYFVRSGITLKVLERRAQQRDRILRAHYRIMVQDIPSHCFVFIDEVASNQNDALRRRGRSYRGTRAKISTCLERGTRLAGLGAVTWGDGVVAFDLLDENVNSVVFDEFMCDRLRPHLNKFSWDTLLPNSIVVVDNAPWHHAARGQWKAMCALRGTRVLWLPAYSPDFNPIELVWAELKQGLKKLGINIVRHDPAFWVRDIMNRVSVAHVRAYIRKCGYTKDAEAEELEECAFAFLALFALDLL